tara:strand:- start:2878 stop:3492 length:615 start_codon:yes stop_codon:yes gene_type:complete
VKLLLENWRKYLLFENIETATRLSIFDFDETIAFTEGHINVLNKETGEKFQTRTQEEYDAIKDDDKYEFDFSPLDVVHNATENPNITAILRDRLQDPNTQVMILTARKQISIDDIHRVLQTFDRPIKADDIIMIGVEGENKGQYIYDNILLSYKNIKEVEFYDDSPDNIRDVNHTKKQIQKERSDINFSVYLVVHGNPEISSID